MVEINVMAIFTGIHEPLRELALFAGGGGGILGGKLLGWRTICAVERDAYAAAILAQRQNDRILPAFPIWSDVCSFDGRPWRGIADIVSGGFPCQDISVVGRGGGIEGERSGLYVEMERIVDEVRPPFVFMENSPMLMGRGFTRVLSGLSSMGYDARWGVMGGELLGRTLLKRLWILGKRDGFSLEGLHIYERASSEINIRSSSESIYDPISKINRKLPKPGVCRMDYELSDRLDRFRAVGNAQIPIVAARAFRTLLGQF